MPDRQETLHRRHLPLCLSLLPPKVKDDPARAPWQQPVDYLRFFHTQILMNGTQVEVKVFQSKKL
jgi:hypothetical protein